ncbi:Pectin methylesterase family protein [Ceratobasidium theobromae]|uniref:Cofilin n=1 Tax=Ceratobasidium theobromae TaxID=1582974 RepID=A0A5N5QVZ5_9AGAM|nr:Pectin methylesterase family protein [Ceratobasidium theobromae]
MRSLALGFAWSLAVGVSAKSIYEVCQSTQGKTSSPTAGCPIGTKYVSQSDKRAKFKNIQEAVLSLPQDTSPQWILIGAGVYKEAINVTRKGPTTLLGATNHVNSYSQNLVTVYNTTFMNQTTQTADQDNADTQVLTVAPNKWSTWTGKGFYGDTPEPVPNATKAVGPALAVGVAFARASFYGCAFKSYQDTVFIGKNGSAVFKGSEVAGSTDYIYGFGKAYFIDSTLSNRGGGRLTAWKGDDRYKNTNGAYFDKCRIAKSPDADPTLNLTGTMGLGRPWNNLSTVAIMNTYMDETVMPAGFTIWGSTDPRFNYNVTYFAEYKSHGPGWNAATRDKSVERILTTAKDVKPPTSRHYTKEGFLCERHQTKSVPCNPFNFRSPNKSYKMSLRLSLRLATRSLRQPVALSPRFAQRTGQRTMSSDAPKQSSDAPWIAVAGVITIGGLAMTFSSGSGGKDSHHAPSHASKPKPAPKEKKDADTQKSDDNKGSADKSEGDASPAPAEVQESIKQSVKADEPSTAKAEEAKAASPKKDSGPESGSDEDYVQVEKPSPEEIKDSLVKSEKADVPAVAKPSEEKEARSKSNAALGQPDLAAGPLYSLHYRGLPHISTFPLFYLILFESTWYVRAASCALRWTRLNDAKNPLPTKSSGVTVNDECNKIYQTLKLGKTIKYVIFRLSDDKATIVENCRWAVYDLAFEKEGEGQRNKIVFLSWSPADSKIRERMTYASSKEALRKSLDGIASEVQATDADEVAYETVLDKVTRR